MLYAGSLAVRLGLAFIARGLALVWAGIWVFSFIAEVWVYGAPARVVPFWAGVGLLFVIVALVPWRWEVSGGVLLVVVGLLNAVAYAVGPPPGLPLASRLITTVVLSAPPLVAGTLFPGHHRVVPPEPEADRS
jgi:hypothetical protein